MNSTQRRKGIRFPWQTDDEQSSASGISDAGGDAMAVPEDDVRGVLQRADAAPAEAAGEVVTSDQPVPEDFMHELVAAMRRVAEQQRDEAVEQLRAAVAEQTEGVRTAAETRAAELRDRAEQEITMIGEWEQLEVQRIHDEALSNTAARRQRLESDLVTNNAESEAAQEAADRVIASFQRSMEGFFEKLGATADPVAFASAAMHMPQPPALTPLPATSEPERPAEPVPWPDESASATSSEPAMTVEPAAGAAEAPAPEPIAAEAAAPAEAAAGELAAKAVAEAAVETAVPVAAKAAKAAKAAEPIAAEAAAPAEAAEVSTQIVVTGLTSFGAITSFKQSLEHAEGVRRVSLGLGAAGEFIFTAVHPEGFDLSSAIRTFESGAEFHVAEDRLSVTVGATV